MEMRNEYKEMDDHSIKWDDILVMLQIIPSYMNEYDTIFTIYYYPWLQEVCPVCSVKVVSDMLSHITVQHGHLFKISFCSKSRFLFFMFP